MVKKILIAIVILIVVIAGAMALLWYFMGKALYQPGMVRAQGVGKPPRQSGDQQFWEVEKGIKIHYFTQGKGRKILFIHGGPGQPGAKPLSALASLTQDYQIIYYHQRGCGKSTRPITEFSSKNFYHNLKTLDRSLGLATQIADIERIRLILDEPQLILIGHSFGGFLAALYAAEFPERVKAMVLIAPANVLVMPITDGNLFTEVARLLPASKQSEYQRFLDRYFDFGNIFSQKESDLVALNEEFAKYYLAAARAKGWRLPQQIESSGAGGWMVHAMFLSMGRRHDYRNALKKVPVPVLVIHGEKDIQPARISRVYSDLFPQGQFYQMQAAGHFPFYDNPQQFAATLAKFLATLK